MADLTGNALGLNHHVPALWEIGWIVWGLDELHLSCQIHQGRPFSLVRINSAICIPPVEK